MVDTEEAGNILMTLAKQAAASARPPPQRRTTSGHLTGKALFQPKCATLTRHPSLSLFLRCLGLPMHGSYKPSSMTSRERARSDPIILLAAAAAAIDSSSMQEHEPNHYGRPYERREFVIQRRPSESKSPLSQRFGVNAHCSIFTGIRRSSAMPMNQDDRGDTHHAQHYMSIMKHHPNIKRNAMHAYIAYMIYTDLAKDPAGTKYRPLPTTVAMTAASASSTPHYTSSPHYTAHEPTSSHSMPLATQQRSPPAPYPMDVVQDTRAVNKEQHQRQYSLPPPPSPPAPANTSHRRPLTAFLWESSSTSTSQANNASPSKMILPPLASPPFSSPYL
ncbi:hypothetical protein BC940DRAFT_311730 [Gongronella butleri]|nr:hypothetical protein BC940DRAFT_311730 [Gongronella butleri]